MTRYPVYRGDLRPPWLCRLFGHRIRFVGFDPLLESEWGACIRSGCNNGRTWR